MRKRKGLYIATAAIVTAIAGTLVMANGGINIAAIPLRASSQITGGTLTFDATNVISCTASSDSGRYNTVLETTTSSGNVYQLHVINSTAQPAGTTSGSTFGNISTYQDVTSKIYVTSSFAPNAKVFQKINSITVGSNSTAVRTTRLFFNGQETYDSFQVASRTETTYNISSSTTLGGKNARSFELQYVSASNLAVRSFTINYDCSSDYIDDATLSSISLSGDYKTEFAVDEQFSYDGLVVTANYSDLSSATVTPASVSTPDMTSAGEKTVTVSYTEGGITKTAEYTIEVVESVVKTKYGVKVSSTVLSIDLSTNIYTMIDYDSSVYTLEFSYVISGSSITFTLVNAGDYSNMSIYRLFETSTKGSTNTGTIVEGTSIVIKTYTPYGTSNTRTFTTAYFD